MTDENYVQWLDRLYAKVPKTVAAGSRFEVPDPICNATGNRIFIQNFKQICEIVGREQQHLLRYLSRELATAGSIEGDQAAFQGKFNSALIKRIVEDYVQEFVICPVCRSPDTELVREERFRFLVCEACGARSSVRVV